MDLTFGVIRVLCWTLQIAPVIALSIRRRAVRALLAPQSSRPEPTVSVSDAQSVVSDEMLAPFLKGSRHVGIMASASVEVLAGEDELAGQSLT
jgi:hypothetical protein